MLKQCFFENCVGNEQKCLNFHDIFCAVFCSDADILLMCRVQFSEGAEVLNTSTHSEQCLKQVVNPQPVSASGIQTRFDKNSYFDR